MDFLSILLIAVSLLLFLIALFNFRKRRADKRKEKWLQSLQEAHDQCEYDLVLDLMKGHKINSSSLYFVLGNAQMMTGKHDLARKTFFQVIETGENKNEIQRVLGLSEFNAGNYIEAINALQKIEKDYLEDWFKIDEKYDVIEFLGRSFYEINQIDLAIEALKGAPIGKRKLNDTLNNIIVLLGDCYERKKSPKNAEKYYTKSLAYRFNPELNEKLNAVKAKVKSR